MLRIRSDSSLDAMNPDCPKINPNVPWGTLSTICVIAAFGIQLITGILMIYYTSAIISTRHDELAAQPAGWN